MISGFNTEREVAQLRIAQEFHLERIEEIKQYIEELEESMAPASGKTEKMYTFVKLGRRVDYHKKRMAEIAARICLLRHESNQGDNLTQVSGVDEEGELQLVTGRIGTGKTSFGISLAEQEDEIISNLESVEGAFFANSPSAIWEIIVLNPETRFAVLLDDFTVHLGCLQDRELKSRKLVELVSDLVDLGHRVILTGPVLDDFPDELLYYREGEWDDAVRDVYHITERGRVVYRDVVRVGVDLETRDKCEFPAARPSRAFDSQEFSEFAVCRPEGKQDEPVEVRPCSGKTVDGDACGALIRDPDEGERLCDPHKGQQEELSQASGADEDREFFDPDDWPPQFHIDELEMQLDFNLGQVYGFCDLDKQSQADLAKLAVEYELDAESVQNILNICRALGSLDGDRD